MNLRTKATNHSNLGLTAILGVALGGNRRLSRNQGTLEPRVLSFESCQHLEEGTLLGSGDSMDITFAPAREAKVMLIRVTGISLLGRFEWSKKQVSRDSDRMPLTRQTHRSALRNLCPRLGYGHVILVVIGIPSTHSSPSCPCQLSLRSIHNALFTRLSAFLETNRQQPQYKL
jgi:hypothetical protein